jgi:hypothetical protein
LRSIVAIARAGQPYQSKSRIVDNELRLRALRRQCLADQPRDAGFQEINCNDHWPARAGCGNFVGERAQSILSSRDQSQFVALLSENARQCHADPCGGAGDDGDWPQAGHSRVKLGC